MAYYQKWQVCVMPCTSLTELFESKKYVKSTLSVAQLPSVPLHLSTPVHAAWSGKVNVTLKTATRKGEIFDNIIFTCHSHDALRIVDAGSGATPTDEKFSVCSAGIGMKSGCVSMRTGSYSKFVLLKLSELARRPSLGLS